MRLKVTRLLPAVIAASAMLSACGSDANNSETDMVPEQQPDSNEPADNGISPPPAPSSTTSASYRVTFEALWSIDTHPQNFPASAHFSRLSGAVHNAQVVFWESGQFASSGIEVMAESGATGALQDEVQQAINEGFALASIGGGGVAVSPGQATAEFTVNSDYPLVSIVTMVAPSPDWFLGVHGQSLTGADGEFVDSLTVDLPVYDAGTDGGTGFTAADNDSDEPIALLTSDPVDTNFVNGLPIAGQLVFQRLGN